MHQEAPAGAVGPGCGMPLRIAAGAQARVAGLRGWQRLAAAFLAGALSVLALAPFHVTPVLLITLPMLVWLLDGSGPSAPDPAAGRPRDRTASGVALRAAAVGWWFGFGYFLLGLFWIGEAFLVEAEIFAWLLPFAVTLMPAGLALFHAAACGLARLYWPPGIARILVLAVALTGAEWLRGHILTGFPWNLLGYALAHPLVLMQSAAAVGIYGLTLLVLPVFAAPLVLAAAAASADRDGRRRAMLAVALVSGLPLLAMICYGALRLAGTPAPMVEGVRLRIVQPSIPQREKWQGDKQARNFQLHLELSRTAPNGRRDDLAGITHVVWPEAAMPFLPLETPEALQSLGTLLPPRTYLMTGALRLGPEPPGEPDADRRRTRRPAYNSFMVFGPGGGLAALYDKIHLVPFGEYLPLQPALEAIGLQQLTRMRGGFSTGERPRPLLSIPGLPPVAALVCYEAIFPQEVVQGARPGVFVNVTNDGWFGTMTGPYQHLHQARVRAVEHGVPLVRAANNGVSAVFDAEGRQIAALGLNVRGTIDTALPAARPPTPYSRFGDIPLIGCMIVMILALLRQASGRRSL